jgi:2-polyprenyl-6-methoxyphenol hydroxylase-like FAD-dependent oxidoreductase
MTSPATATEPVAIVGAGPVGLALALGLANHGVRSVVLEQASSTSEHSKAAGIHVRTREVLRQWGIEDRLLDAGHLVTELALHDVDRGDRPFFRVDLSELDDEAERPGLLMLEQSETERHLLEAVRASGLVDVRFDTAVTGLTQRDGDVALLVSHAGREDVISASYAVGCDGASSSVRRELGLPFEGSTYRLRPLLADVVVDDTRDGLPWPRARNGTDGITAALRLRPGRWRILHLSGTAHERSGTDDEVVASAHGSEATVPDAEVARHVEAVLGPGAVDVVWASRFRIHRRATPRSRRGRVLLAGDAAHVHSPVGGLGMNAGVQDAHNLAWKLAAVLAGGERERLLDSYDVERRAVVAGTVSGYTDAVTRLYLQSPARVRAGAFAVQRGALRLPGLRRRALRRMTMLDLGYGASPLLDPRDRAAGDRLPDLRLHAVDGTRHRLHTLVGDGAALLAVASGAYDPARDPSVSAVDRLLRIGPRGLHEPTGTLRRWLGGRDGWILVRPDLHVAWARIDPDGLDTAIRGSLGGTWASGRAP